MNRLLLLVCWACIHAGALAREFSVLTYNVDNLFDVDGVAVYDDYGAERYGPEQLERKLSNIARVIKSSGSTPPQVIVLNEVELDQTPRPAPPPLTDWLDSVRHRDYRQLLSNPDRALRTLPADYWLVKALEDEGLGRYSVVTSDERPGAYGDGRGIAVRNAILTSLPVIGSRSHRTSGARAIVEAKLDVDGHPVTIFANHWKSGASQAETEHIRIGNAQTLRARIDEILKVDPMADIIVAGDLNSHHNQAGRYPYLPRTAIEGVLLSTGDEREVSRGVPALYNLWYEIDPSQRGSDVYRGEWGTLMHLLVSSGLYDSTGVTYVDNSFRVVVLPGVNADSFGRPVRWNPWLGEGVSDHLPLIARFTSADASNTETESLSGNFSSNQSLPIPVRSAVPSRAAIRKSDPRRATSPALLQQPENIGGIFEIDGGARVEKGGVVVVKVGGEWFDVFSHDPGIRGTLRRRAQSDGHLRFFGELGNYQGKWQLVVSAADWIAPPPPSLFDRLRDWFRGEPET